MQIVVWVLFILVVIFLIWLLRRWIKRIIFILILLVLAFFIYGIFNPSGAARLWYNVRTFPSRIASLMGSGKEILDYNTYKSKISSIGDDISDTISDNIDNIGDNDDLFDDEDIDDFDSLDDKFNVDLDYDRDYDGGYEEEKQYNSKKGEESTKNKGKNFIKAFPKIVRFIELPEIKREEKSETENVGQLSGYSRTDLLGVINRYLEKNLDDDTDVLVTVEYEDDSADPQKIILQTQAKKEHSVINSNNLEDEVFPNYNRKIPEEIEIIPVESTDSEIEEIQPIQKQESVKEQGQTTKKTTSTTLTQKEKKEAEEIFSILF